MERRSKGARKSQAWHEQARQSEARITADDQDQFSFSCQHDIGQLRLRRPWAIRIIL